MSEDYFGKNNDVDDNESRSHTVYDEEKREDQNTLNIEPDAHGNGKGTIAATDNAKLYVILGWISAAVTFFISPLFAVAGITFGILLNRQIKGSGNTLIVVNIVLALINLVLGIVFVLMTQGMMGY